ncbi:hypothetical protein NTCA1_11880 [Novosphingobium sp. TCA1]|nr:hypothetical protein NTCA1_11880 [Novosphingobium sp. TCA1]
MVLETEGCDRFSIRAAALIEPVSQTTRNVISARGSIAGMRARVGEDLSAMSILLSPALFFAAKLIVQAPRHPELVSGSILPLRPTVGTERWILKQVQDDA